MTPGPLPSQPSNFDPLWSLGRAQAQWSAIAAALMPLGLAPSGRVQVPSVEIEDRADVLIVTAFLPGVEPRQVQVRASATSLTFAGQQSPSHRRLLMSGLGINYFQQTVPLPVRVVDRAMAVTHHDGAVVVTLPKETGWGQRLRLGWRRSRTWLRHRLNAWAQRQPS